MKKLLKILTITSMLSASALSSTTAFAQNYKVKKGDTLYAIAKKYKTNVSQIQKDNHLKSMELKINQILTVNTSKTSSNSKVLDINFPLKATQSNVKSYMVTGESEENTKVYLLFIDEKGGKLTTDVKVNSKGQFSKKIDISKLRDGSIKLSIYQKALKGEIKNTGTESFIKDTAGPVISIDASNSQSSLSLSGVVDANSKIEFTVTDSVKKSIKKMILADNAGKFATSLDIAELKDGALEIKTIAYDYLGNMSTKTVKINKTTVDKSVYVLDAIGLAKFKIYNNGTHAVDTTKGLNDALIWAKDNGFTTTLVPKGTYLISKGTKEDDRSASINLLSNMTLELDKDAVFQKETNGYKGYSIIYVAPGVENAKIKGGALIGDREKHDFSAGGTQEWGHGVLISGGNNITVDGVKIQKMNGDGIYVGMSPVWGAWEAKYGGTPKSTIELGGVDDSGNLVDASGKVRNIGWLEIAENTPDKYRMINVWIPQGMSSNRYDIYYYNKDKVFISKDSAVMNSTYSKAPKDARYYRLVFSAPKLEGVYALMYHLDIATNVVIKNSDIGFNRRQGITANGENVQILNNYIHDTKGTAPQAGIDIEPGFATAYNHTIQGNTFENNVIQMVASKGENLLIQDNKFIINKNVGGNGVGLHVWDNYKNVQILNNTFEGRGLTTLSAGSILEGNKFTNATASLEGFNQTFSKGNFVGGTLNIKSSAKVTDTTITSGGSLMVNGKIEASNVILTGTENKPVTLGGFAAKDSTYDHLTAINAVTGSTSIPSGIYTNSSFTYTGSGTLGMGIQYGEHVIMDHVTFKNITLNMHSIKHGAEATFKNSSFTYDGELKQPAIQGTDGQSLQLIGNTFTAKKASKGTIISIGKELDMYVEDLLIDSNVFHVTSAVNAIDTTGAGTDKPSYVIQNNLIYNGLLKLTSKDVNTNNQLLKE